MKTIHDETAYDDLFWEYVGIITFMEGNPALYGMDDKRAAIHKRLEKHFPGQEDKLSEVLHDLPNLKKLRPKHLRSLIARKKEER